MKTGHFVEGLSNTARLMAAVSAAEARGAPEASWVLVEGDPGYGKSRALMRLAILKPSVHVRAKADWTPSWCLSDIAESLGLPRGRRKQDLMHSVIAELMQRPKMLIVDEIDHAARKFEVVETLRDITDTVECVLVAGGMKGARGLMKRYPQIYSRIAEIVTFGAASADDVKIMCRALTDVDVRDCLCKRIQEETQGRLRLVMNAIARVEVFGRRGRGPVTADAYAGRALLNDERKAAHG
jgi:hypothetical protein